MVPLSRLSSCLFKQHHCRREYCGIDHIEVLQAIAAGRVVTIQGRYDGRYAGKTSGDQSYGANECALQQTGDQPVSCRE